MDGAIVLGDQLFRGRPGLPPGPVFMREDYGLCTRWRHHQQKIVLFLASMRRYAAGQSDIQYQRLDPMDRRPYAEAVADWAKGRGISRLWLYEPADRSFLAELEECRVPFVAVPNPGFLTSEAAWHQYRGGHRRLQMADFYRWQRRRLGVLVEPDGTPTGGKWSFDQENRKPWPKGKAAPRVDWPEPSVEVRHVIETVRETFGGHPGDARDFAYPTSHAEADTWLDAFLEERFAGFGDYEDAIARSEDVLYHSVLSPLLNVGLLQPSEVLERALAHPAPMNAKEGFVRQLIGWREFVRGISREYGHQVPNELGHTGRLAPCWWDGTTGLPPLDTVIRGAQARGWRHHIERLMVAGAAMLMCEAAPEEAYRWFMEMFVDSAEWVMGPNVIGMSQFADGGLFATKPYLSGSAYLRRMSDFPPGPWCDVWDGLYWRFVGRHRALFRGNPRLSVVPSTLDGMNVARRERLLVAADAFVARVIRY